MAYILWCDSMFTMPLSNNGECLVLRYSVMSQYSEGIYYKEVMK
jgi:hypothetical protein